MTLNTRIAPRTILEIDAELTQARMKFPMPNRTYVAMCEEVGELAQALLKCKPGDPAAARAVYDEAKQVAVMAIRVMEEGDKDTPSYSPYLGMSDIDRGGKLQGGDTQFAAMNTAGEETFMSHKAVCATAHAVLTDSNRSWTDRISRATAILSQGLNA